MAVQCVLAGKGKDDVFTAIYGETTFDKVSKAYNEKKVVQVIYQNRIYYLDNTTSGAAFSFISSFSNKNSEIEHYVISLSAEGNWSEPSLQNSTPAIHANTHTKNGTDPLAPADIGAMELSESVLKQSGEDITSQVAQALSKNLVPFSGGTMTGLLNVLTPVGDSNATTKKYVDDALSEKIGMDGIGDLHVWKKTVVTTDPIPEVPASFKLGDVEELHIATRTNSNSSTSSYIKLAHVGDGINVTNAGDVSLKNDMLASNRYWYISGNTMGFNDITSFIGKYIMFDNNSNGMYCDITCPLNTIYYIPENSEAIGAGYNYLGKAYFTKAQKVIGIPYIPAIPAETTITYPVSTNRNAYQEGSDAKPAGYTLGAVKTGKHILSYQHSNLNEIHWEYSSRITVSDDGIVSLVSPSSEDIDGGDYTSVAENLIGKFARPTEDHSGFTTNVIVFFPSDATVTRDTTTYGYNTMTISKYQPVTGYAAIPANTTIEYLGCLGEKVSIKTGTYIGTGLYGASNPVTISPGFRPRFVLVYGYNRGAYLFDGLSYVNLVNHGGLMLDKITWKPDSVSWYSDNGANAQANEITMKYSYFVLG